MSLNMKMGYEGGGSLHIVLRSTGFQTRCTIRTRVHAAATPFYNRGGGVEHNEGKRTLGQKGSMFVIQRLMIDISW